MSEIPQTSCRNNLLSIMSADDFGLVQPFLSPLDLNTADVLIKPHEPFTEVYFVETGLISVVAENSGKQQVEVGIYGFEGMGSTASALQVDRCPHEHIVQMEGTAFRMSVADLAAALRSSASLQALLLRYAYAFGIQTASTAVSNGICHLGQRLARWLLMCQDRNGSRQVHMTHEFLAIMLAARRPSVTEAINELEGLDLINAQRGIISILDREGLKLKADACYGVPEVEYRRLIGPPEIFR